MIKKITLLSAVALTTTFISCQKKESIESPAEDTVPKTFALLEKANWLVGEWGNVEKEGVLTENWIKQNDSIYTGQSYFISNKDTLHLENIVMKQKGDSLFYIPTIKNQNDGKPVSFKMTNISENQLVFENKSHDFPQKITYFKVNNNQLIAEISGVIDGKEKKENYPLKKK
jgi:hypothetical protein